MITPFGELDVPERELDVLFCPTYAMRECMSSVARSIASTHLLELSKHAQCIYKLLNVFSFLCKAKRKNFAFDSLIALLWPRCTRDDVNAVPLALALRIPWRCPAGKAQDEARQATALNTHKPPLSAIATILIDHRI